MTGPLKGIRIIQMTGIGPGPFCGMMLADHGAQVVRIERPGAAPDPDDPFSRSQLWMNVDVRIPEGVALVRDLVKGADGLIEGYRPGVMERLGLGPDVLLADNPKLVYGRMTGYGQHGPHAHTAGHDINFIAASGVLHTVGVGGGRPIPPVNYIGDFGGGGLMLAFAMVSALLAVRMGGPGDVIDAAMTDGSALLAGMTWYSRNRGGLVDRPGVNLLDGGAHFYDTYECADGKYVALGAIEPQFYRLLCQHLGVADDPAFADQMNRALWPDLKLRVAEIFKTRTRDEWCDGVDVTDACLSPVMSLAEAPRHPHNVARGTFIEADGRIQPAPAPRYRTQSLEEPRTCAPGSDRDEILRMFGCGEARAAELAAPEPSADRPPRWAASLGRPEGA